MHILFVCHMLPHRQARDSGRLDTYAYIEALSHNHEVTLIAFVPEVDQPGVADLHGLGVRVTAVVYQPHALIPRLQRAWGRLWHPKVYGRNRSRPYRRQLQALIANHQFDVALVHGMMADYYPYLTPIPAVLDEVDLFSMVAQQLFRQERNPLSRLWLGFDWLRTLVQETHHLHSYQGVLVRSVKDQAIVQEFAPAQRVAVLPPWFEGLTELADIPLTRPAGDTLLFVGAMNLPPNIEAVTFFVREVLPLVQAVVPTAVLQIVGANPAPAVQALADYPGVELVGEVASLRPYYENTAVAVVPLFIGGGIIVKTLNALASGRPVVTTPLGNSGTGAEPGQHLCLVPPHPPTMAAAIIHLLQDNSAWQELAEHGRGFIQTQYNWAHITHNLTQFLQETTLPPDKPPTIPPK
jgi:polysaccharide biosynthesis protein PslH